MPRNYLAPPGRRASPGMERWTRWTLFQPCFLWFSETLSAVLHHRLINPCNAQHDVQWNGIYSLMTLATVAEGEIRVLSNYLDVGVVKVSITCNKDCLVRGQMLLCPCWRGEEQNPAWAEQRRKKRGTMLLQCGFAKLPQNCCFLSPGGQYLSNAIQYIHHRQSIKS